MQTQPVSVQPVTMETKASTELTSTATSELTRSNLPKLRTSIITTEKFLTPSGTILTTAAIPTIATAPILTSATVPIVTRSLTSSLLTTEVFTVRETLTTAGTASSLTVAFTNKTTTEQKLSVEEQVVI